MLYRMDAVEQVGSSIRRIREICKEHGITLALARPKLNNGVRVHEDAAPVTTPVNE